MTRAKTKKLLLYIAIPALIVIVGVYFIVEKPENSDDEYIQPKSENFSSNLEFITVQTYQESDQIKIQGRLLAESRLELFPEVQGKLGSTAKPFKEGITFSKGETVFRIEDEEARLQLYASRSQFQALAAALIPDIKLDFPDRLEAYEQWFNQINPVRSLSPIPDFGDTKLRQFLSTKNLYNSYYNIKSGETRLEKFKLKAPFNGTLSATYAEPGQSVGPHTHLGTFVDPHNFRLTAAVRPEELPLLEIGRSLSLQDENGAQTWEATLQQINPSVDIKSQTVEIYLSVKGEGLREGMFLEGSLSTDAKKSFARIPKSALLRTGYVYLVKDEIIRLHPVKVEEVLYTEIIVSGLQDEDEIIRDASQSLAGKTIAGS